MRFLSEPPLKKPQSIWPEGSRGVDMPVERLVRHPDLGVEGGHLRLGRVIAFQNSARSLVR